jgi:peptidyl-prolyl cis-trans isomerase D
MALAVLRRHRRWLFVFLWLVIGSFIILYIPASQRGGGGDERTPGETLARVGDLPITVGEFQKAHQRLQRGYEQMYRGRLDAAALRNLGLEEQALSGLVEERIVTLEARRLGLVVDDASLARELSTAPEFQQGGHFVGASEIRRVLEMQGVSEEEFVASLRDRILRQRLESLVTDGASVAPAELEREFRRRNEQVRLEYVLADAARFRAGLVVSDDEVKARFEAQKDSYKLPERRVVAYLAVESEALRPKITVTDGEIETYYRDHEEEYKQPEERCASHILVKVAEASEDKSAPAPAGHTDEEGKRIAEDLLKQLQAGADFAELAKKKSEDQGSAQSGGDLGALPGAAWCPPSRAPPLLSSPVPPRIWSSPTTATTSSDSSRSATKRCSRCCR